MKIYIDADALPKVLKPILARAVERLGLAAFVVANSRIRLGTSPTIVSLQVGGNPDEADDKIVELVLPGDLVVTGDIPLADRVVTKGAFALNHRGELFTEDNVKEALAMRNLMQEMRDNGMVTGGPAQMSERDKQSFANALNAFLTGRH
jgi:uncharacterized protein YaiI (UPF0178 family)